MKPWKIGILVLVVSLLVLITIGLVVTVSAPEDPDVVFTFLGYKSGSGGPTEAMFQVRYSDTPRICIGMLPPQIFSEGEWRWSRRPVARDKSVLTTDAVWTVGYPAPSLSNTWRVAMILRSEKSDRFQEKIHRFLFRYPSLRSDKEIFGRYAFSEPIPPPVEPYLHYTPPKRKPEPPSLWE